MHVLDAADSVVAHVGFYFLQGRPGLITEHGEGHVTARQGLLAPWIGNEGDHRCCRHGVSDFESCLSSRLLLTTQ